MKTAQESLFQAMVSDDWCLERSGDVESPNGHFALLVNTASDVAQIRQEFSGVLDVCGDVADSDVLGAFIVREDSDGFVFIDRYDSTDEAVRVYADLEKQYGSWCES